MASIAQCLSWVNSIQEQVMRPINEDKHEELVGKLEEVNHQLETLERTSAFAGAFSNNLKEQIISLYGKIDDSLIEHELGTIRDEALVLQNALQNNQTHTISQMVHALKNHIASLWDHYRPSVKERRVIAFAEQQLEKAASFDRKERIISLEERLETESALVLIGEALSDNDETRAAFEFNRLNAAQQKLLCSYLPKEDQPGFLHEVKGATNHNKIFLRNR